MPPLKIGSGGLPLAQNSDVDLIAEFDHSIGYLELSRIQRELEGLLKCRVDLATPGMIRKEFRERIYAEAMRAA